MTTAIALRAVSLSLGGERILDGANLALPVGATGVVIGETGCGKTALVKFLAATLDFRLQVLDIHGGGASLARTREREGRGARAPTRGARKKSSLTPCVCGHMSLAY